MANTTPSPNMNMPVPNVGVDPSPQWASDINACLSVIDGHNHSLGTGVQITPSGLNINADLPFLSNNATLLRSVRFAPQSSAISGAADLGCLYEAGVDLYYNDGSGNQIRITQAGSVTGSSGTITGLPSGTASAAYAAGTFTFQSATNTAATIDAGSYIFRNLTASSHGVTVSPPNSLGSDYNLILPSIPGVTSLMTLDNSGNMAAVTTVDGTTVIISSNMIEVGVIQTANIANGAVTPAKLSSGFVGWSLGAGLQTYSSAGTYTWTVPTNVTRVLVQGMGGGGGGSQSGANGPNGGNTTFNSVTISQGATGGLWNNSTSVSGPILYAYYPGGAHGAVGASTQNYTGGLAQGTGGGGAASDLGTGGNAGNPAVSASGNGAGGGAYNNGTTPAGGGGGCVLQSQWFTGLTPGSSITVVVGAGGSSSSGSGGNGSDGIINIYY